MSFGHHTPEALLARSDSKNPATTCKGLTAAGRPCRRALSASLNSTSSSPNGQGNDEVVAILDVGDVGAFFCYQHKDQAEALASKVHMRTQVLPLKQKSSVDTLMERVGVLEVRDRVDEWMEETPVPPPLVTAKHPYRQNGLRMRDTLPTERQAVESPLTSVPENTVSSESSQEDLKPVKPVLPERKPRQPRAAAPPRPSNNTKGSWSCCARADEEHLPPPRRVEKREMIQQPPPRPSSGYSRFSSSNSSTFSSAFSSANTTLHSSPSVKKARSIRIKSRQNMAPPLPERRRPISSPETMQRSASLRAASVISYPQLEQLPEELTTTPRRPPLRQSPSNSPPNSQTVALLSLIPDHLSPNTTSALLAELSKPISSADEEGYIYMFWLTPESDDEKPDDETATSILDVDDLSPDSTPLKSLDRRANELNQLRSAKQKLTAQALRRFASVRHNPTEPKKILLKIGRANNVHRRLSQWSKQCGQNITLIRYYPYHRQRSSQVLKQTVPHVHRVERLIHLELADQRVADKGRCGQCGREHKEWFEVDATRDGVKAVDEVVRRWVSWAENLLA